MKAISYFALAVSVMFGVVLGNLGSELILRGLDPAPAAKAPMPTTAISPEPAPALEPPPPAPEPAREPPALPVVKLKPADEAADPTPLLPPPAADETPLEPGSAPAAAPVADIQWEDPATVEDERRLKCQRFRYLYDNEPTEANAEAVLEWCGRPSRRVEPRRVQAQPDENR